MANLSPPMKREMKRSNGLLRYGVRFTFPNGEVEQYSDVGWCSLSLGLFEPRVKEWGTMKSSVGDRRNNFEVANATGMQILDHRDRWKVRDAQMDLKGTIVEYFYMSPRIPSGARLLRWKGAMLGWSVGQGVVNVNEVGPPFLLALRGPVPHQRIIVPDFLDLPDEAVDLWSAIGPYGRHDSFAFGNLRKGDNDGQVTPLYVGEYTEENLLGNEITGSKYIIGPGRISGIVHAYENEVKVVKDTNWSRQSIWEVINGVQWSRIQFNSNKSAKRITLDVDGYERIGDGSGVMIEDPVEMVVHWLTNFVFARYQSGLWLPTSEHIDADLIAAATRYFGKLRTPSGYKNAFYLEASQQQKTAMEVLNQWTQSNESKSYTTFQGKLGFGADSFDNPGRQDEPHIRRAFHELLTNPAAPTKFSLDVAKRISGETSHSHALGNFTERLSIVSAAQFLEESADSISCPWGPAHL